MSIMMLQFCRGALGPCTLLASCQLQIVCTSAAAGAVPPKLPTHVTYVHAGEKLAKSSDFAKLADEAARMKACGADWLHMDVMDGHFVPNLTLGAPIVKALRKHTDAFLDCHLMVSEPEKWVDDFAAAGASTFTFHIEATKDADALIDRIIAAGMKPAVSIKPKTPVEDILAIAGRLYMVLIMTVEPGFGGQKFMPDMMPKVRLLRERFPLLNIQVDGGIGLDNIEIAAEAGANVFVAGTAIFGSKSPADTIAQMRAAAQKHLA